MCTRCLTEVNDLTKKYLRRTDISPHGATLELKWVIIIP